ncbi:hypothetical protein CLPUN_28810 [Clostridium puniceum]|uniref:Uncharacterized protein n=1 Tax=Clostridium puniceum TaxID=29367 RepID=A0A1S8TE25_9CLOT|nr:hypothetical protein [Clostridium puniceum]OOM76033.1 hypothetical protein CLPUN_28810 [Clostridium puniceum]
MEAAIKSVAVFLLLYFSYYYALRFIQSIFQGAIGSISSNLGKFIYALSTPAHELAHLLVAILCLAKIEEVKLLPNANTPGYVKSRISSNIPFLISIKGFFIAIAPALVNIPLFIFIESKFVLKCEISEISRILDPRFLITKEGLITILLFLVLISGIAPSHEDFKGMIKGLIIFSVVIFGLSFVTSMFLDMKWVNINPILTVIFYYLEIIIGVLIINAIINYRNCIRITWAIIINALKHTFKRN